MSTTLKNRLIGIAIFASLIAEIIVMSLCGIDLTGG